MAIKKLTKTQTIILVTIGVVIFLGFGMVNIIQVKKPSKKSKASASETAKMPDPGAEARKKYQDNKKKEAEEKTSSQQAEPLMETDVPPIIAPAPASTSKKKSKDKTKKNNVVSSDDRGEISGVLPSGSILTETPVEAPPTPAISAPKDDAGRKVVETPTTRLNTSNVTPGIPTGLLDQTPPELGQRSQQALIPPKMVIRPGRYLFNNLTDDALRSPSIKFQSGGPSYNLDKFAPQGEMIDIVLMHNAASEQSEIPVTAAVWTPFYFQGHRILNTGDKLLGRAQKGKKDRLLIAFDKVIFKSGKSTPINAVALDTDGTAGVEGYMVGDILIQSLGYIATEAAGELLQNLTQRAQETTQSTQSIYYGGMGVSNNQNQVSGDVVSAMGSAVTKAAQKIEEVLKQEQEENKPYVLVPAGTRARALLMAPFDPTNADYGK